MEWLEQLKKDLLNMYNLLHKKAVKNQGVFLDKVKKGETLG